MKRLNRAHLQNLLDVLRDDGWDVIGPTVRDGAIVYDSITTLADLPQGWTDEQEAGRYRLVRRDDDALFGYAVGPHSWKKVLHPPVLRLFSAQRTEGGWKTEPGNAPRRTALLGVRACELNAIRIQDRVFLGSGHVDEHYRARREQIFIIGVNCGVAGGTCFCVSMKTGPELPAGFDLALTEMDDGFLIEAGSERGTNVLERLPTIGARADDAAAKEHILENTRNHMGRTMPVVKRFDLEHPRWEEVANRCLACTNCTMVCPTCFCTSVNDVTDLSGENAERVRTWDSCFTQDFSYLHGGSVRESRKSRYRQWLTHKLDTWVDQFGSSGCVGCGRCISWCPVGIDITEEVKAMQGGDAP